jgi:hypothetical protein
MVQNPCQKSLVRPQRDAGIDDLSSFSGRERRRPAADASEAQMLRERSKVESNRVENAVRRKCDRREDRCDSQCKPSEKRTKSAMRRRPVPILAAAGDLSLRCVSSAHQVRPEHVVEACSTPRGGMAHRAGHDIAKNGNDGNPAQPVSLVAKLSHR